MFSKTFVSRAAFALLVFFTVPSPSQQSPYIQNYTLDLLRQARSAQIQAYLDTDFDVCDNFYEHACGNWKRIHPTSVSTPKTSYLGQMEDLFIRKSISMLKNSREIDNDIDTKLKNFFESCTNEMAVRQVGLEPVLKVAEFRGGWPKIYSWSWYEYEYDWLKTIAELRRKLGVDIMVGLDIVPDFEDREVQRIKIGAPKFDLGPKAKYLDDAYEDEREQYVEHIASQLRKHFSEMPANWAHEVANQVLLVETKLAKGLPDNTALTMKQTTRQRSPAELKAAYGNYADLSRYLTIVFNETVYLNVYETPEDYMSNLVDVIRRTPKMTIANYTMWRVLQHVDFAGPVHKKSNNYWCVQRVMEFFPQHLEDMFSRYFNAIKMSNELHSVWADVKRTFRQELQSPQHLNWIAQETRQKCIEKLDSMGLEIAKYDYKELEQDIREVFLTRTRYFENLLQVLQWQSQKRLAQLVKQPEEGEKLNAQLPKYEHITNRVMVPVKFLQLRFLWDPAYPHALKYSTLGVLLAREMLHGFDAFGRKYDKNGYQRQWWDNNSAYGFDERAHSIAKQYADYKYLGKEYIDPNTVTTAILDNGALGVAYRAYQKWQYNADGVNLGLLENLPELDDYSSNQLFFIGFAQLYCADYHESLKKLTELPERIRVNGALSNFKDFARESNCRMDAKMNPIKKNVIF